MARRCPLPAACPRTNRLARPRRHAAVFERSCSCASRCRTVGGNRVSEWLVASGCLYALAWGQDGSVWDDAVDWANIGAFDFKPIPPERFVMTTWHDDETIDEVFWFARHSAEHPTVALRSDLILDIASASHEVDATRAWAGAFADEHRQ